MLKPFQQGPCWRNFLLLLFLCAQYVAEQPVVAQNPTVENVLDLPTHRIPYGSGPLQFGELRLPEGEGPHPVAIVIHGGCWLAWYNLDHISSFCAALTRAGVATWSLEYRRVGNTGGGWPGTFEDVARGADHLRELAGRYPLDLDRVIAIGHSAGGHLVLWLAARHRLPKESVLYSREPLPLRGVVSLAGVPDLRKAGAEAVCGSAISQLVGGPPVVVPERYQQGSPIELLPLGVPQRLIHGARDRIVPPKFAKDYAAAARERGDDVKLVVLEEAAHFELIAPGSSAWPAVEQSVFSQLGLKASH